MKLHGFFPQGNKLRAVLLTRYFGSADFNVIDKLDGISNKPNSAIKAGYSSDQGTGSIRLRSGLSLPELQCMLDENGATDLVIDLIISEPSHIVFFECLHLAIALLEGGNSAVQVNIGYFWLSTNIVLVFFYA